jgi:3-hydroxyisobutyrate dehydrogenase
MIDFHFTTGHTMTTAKMGFIGLGNMGAPMTRRLLDAGFAVSIWFYQQDLNRA